MADGRSVRRGLVVAAILVACRGGASASPDEAAEPTPTPTLTPTGAEQIPAATPNIERITFAEALARARARNPNALTAAQEVQRAEALLSQVRSASLPSVNPQATYTRLDSNRRFMDQVIQAADQVTASGGIGVPLVVPARWAAWAHAADNQRVAQLDVAAVQRQVAIAVAHAFLNVIAQHRVVDALVNARESTRAHADFAQKQYAAGAVSQLDAVRSAQQWRTAEAQLRDGIVALRAAQEALGVLVAGNHPLDVADVPALPLPPVSDRPQDSLEALRADIIALRMRQIAAQRVLSYSWTEYMPSLIGQFDPLYNNPPTIFQPRFAWQGQLTLTLPVLEGGLRSGEVRERRAELSQASIALEAQLRQARADVRFGFEAVALAEERLREAAAAAKLARDAVQMASLRYREGATTNLEVIDAERQSRNTDLGEAAAEDNVRQTRLDLLAAAGRFP
jgi:outer membrane protein TolC